MVDNFSTHSICKAFSHGDVSEPEQTLINTVSAYAINDSDEPKQIIVDLHFEQSAQWRKTNSFDLSDSVTLKENFGLPQLGKQMQQWCLSKTNVSLIPTMVLAQNLQSYKRSSPYRLILFCPGSRAHRLLFLTHRIKTNIGYLRQFHRLLTL